MSTNVKSRLRPVGEKLLDRLLRRIQRYIVMSDENGTAVALWVAHTHCFSQFRASPRLGITSPERGCGKSTLLHFLSHVVRSGLVTAHVTPAAVFHEIDANKATLLFDEADASFGANELIAILNTGFQRDSAFVLRARNTGTVKYSTWAPAAFAVLNQVPDTLASRSIIIDLRRKSSGQICKPLNDRAIRRCRKLKRALQKWCQETASILERARPQMPADLQNRAADIWLPLLAIADAAGGKWPELARHAAKSLTKKEKPAIGTQLLADIRQILGSEQYRIFSNDLAAKLATFEDRPWPNFEGHGSITTASIAKLLAPYGIAPRNIRDGDRVLRGYRRKQFDDAFARYLEVESSS